MAHFAQVDTNNIVGQVLVVPDEQEHRGEDYLVDDCGLDGVWLQTSYNTVGGQHLNGGTAFRKNYAGVGYTYDEGRDAFIPPQPFPSWVLNETTCQWDAPVPYPDDGQPYEWDEDTVSWVQIELGD